MSTYSLELKKELINVDINNSLEAMSELCGIVKSSGEISLSYKKEKIIILTEFEELFERVNKLLNILYGASCEFSLSDEQAYSRNRYEIVINHPYARDFLEDSQILIQNEEGLTLINKGISEKLINSENLARSFLRGVILGGSSSNIVLNGLEGKATYGYQIEFNLGSLEFARDFSNLLAELEIVSKMVERKNSHIVYVKDFNQICYLLELVGAKKSYLKLQDENTYRAFKNQINRQNNCEVANITKTVNASLKQLKAIKQIKQTIGLESLPQDLQEICLLRLANENESLENLCKLLNNNISKSSLNRRLSKIIKIADSLK